MHSKDLHKILLSVCAVLAFGILANLSHAQSAIEISPAALEVSEQVPPAPARISLFAWQGISGTTYTIKFLVDAEPSLVVGIGASVLTTSYDQNTQTLSVTAQYSGEKILVNDNIILPDNSFLIALDPGVDGAVLPAALKASSHTVTLRATKVNQKCYGPGAKPSLYEDTSDDFGEDDSLNDPVDNSDGVDSIGLPQEAAGTFASTNVFFWCIVPPQGETQGVGMRLLAAKNATARLDMTLSPGLIDFMGGRLSRTLNSSNLAIFSDELQVGIDVNDTSDGSAIAVSLPINSDSIKVNPQSSALSSRAKRAALRTARATASDSLDKRTISIGVKEALTLSPDSLKVVGNKVIFTGFVDDLSLVGEFVEILRIGADQKCGINVSAVKGTVIARGEIKRDGSYNVKIPASAVFSDKNKNAKLIARIPGDSTKTSRQVSLSNRNRDLRQ